MKSFYFNITSYMSPYTVHVHACIFPSTMTRKYEILNVMSHWIVQLHTEVSENRDRLNTLVYTCTCISLIRHTVRDFFLASTRSGAHVWWGIKPSSCCNQETEKARVRWGKYFSGISWWYQGQEDLSISRLESVLISRRYKSIVLKNIVDIDFWRLILVL